MRVRLSDRLRRHRLCRDTVHTGFNLFMAGSNAEMKIMLAIIGLVIFRQVSVFRIKSLGDILSCMFYNRTSGRSSTLKHNLQRYTGVTFFNENRDKNV